MINFDITKAETRLIHKIVMRAVDKDSELDTLDLHMDIAACHKNGCPLDLEKLLAFDEFNFAHDIYGIRGHIDRKTGQLLDFFSPRCSR